MAGTVWPSDKRVQPWATREVCGVCNRRKSRCCCDDILSSMSSLSEGSEFSFSFEEGQCSPCDQLGGIIPDSWLVTGLDGFETLDRTDFICCDPLDNEYTLTSSGPPGQAAGTWCQWNVQITPAVFPCSQIGLHLRISGIASPQYTVWLDQAGSLGTDTVAIWNKTGLSDCITSATLDLAWVSPFRCTTDAPDPINVSPA